MITKQKIKKGLRWFFLIPKECEVTKLDIQIIIYQFIGSFLLGLFFVYCDMGRI